jgi:hypothetical protein
MHPTPLKIKQDNIYGKRQNNASLKFLKVIYKINQADTEFHIKQTS